MKLSRVSIVVVIAASALALTACSTAPAGPKGSIGSQGPIGKTGATGAAGSQGSAGAGGETGATGATGTTGPKGAIGAAGAPGAAGATGPAGPASIPQYAYIYNLLGETIPSHADVVFSDNGDMSSGFSHVPGTADIVVGETGEYEVSFSLAADNPNQVGLTRNGQLVPGTIFGAGSGEVQNTGTAILSATAGDVLTLRSFEATSAINLSAFAGGSLENADATFTIQKIN
jgi:hypothetical protein